MINPADADEAAGGFTLVELLVAVVVAGILAGILFQFVQGQGEFARFQGAREEVQANSRLVLEMIGSDLRGVPPLAIQEATPSLIRFYTPRNWGVVCQITPSAQVDQANTVVVRMAGSLSSEFVADQTEWGIAVGQSIAPSAPAEAWAFKPDVSVGGATCPAGSIQAAAGGPVDERSFAWTTTGFDSYSTVAALQTIQIGTIAFAYEEVQYDVAPDAEGRFYVRRMSGYSGGNPNMEPLAGPLPSASGLQFQYLDKDGDPVDPVTDPALIPFIAAVQVIVQTESSQEFGSSRTPQDTRDTTLVRLRN